MKHDPASVDLKDHRDATEIATAAGKMLLALQPDPLASDGRPANWVARPIPPPTISSCSSSPPSTRTNPLILPEEATDKPKRLTSPRVWIVDPLRRNVGVRRRQGRLGVNIALVVDAAPAPVPVAGAVAAPALGETLGTERPPTSHSEQRRSSSSAGHDHPPSPPRWPIGSAPSSGRSAAPPRRPRQSSPPRRTGTSTREARTSATPRRRWLSQRPAVCTHHGSTGARCGTNRPDTFLPDLLICRPELANAVIDAVRDVLSGRPGVTTPWPLIRAAQLPRQQGQDVLEVVRGAPRPGRDHRRAPPRPVRPQWRGTCNTARDSVVTEPPYPTSKLLPPRGAVPAATKVNSRDPLAAPSSQPPMSVRTASKAHRDPQPWSRAARRT